MISTPTSLPLRPCPTPVMRRCGMRAFTLTELLVVIGLIVILIAVAVPSFRFLTGSRSTESGGNVIGAMLARARADAVGLQQYRGVAIYRDLATGRFAAAFVQPRDYPFQTWTAGTAAAPTPHVLGEYVADGTGAYYVCILDHADDGTIPLTNPVYWRTLNAAQVNASTVPATAGMILDLIPDRDRQLLSQGIAVRGAGDTVTVGGNQYRYYTPTVVLFDGSGALVSRAHYILSDGLLGYELDNSRIVPNRTLGSNFAMAESQVGFVLYEEELFQNGTGGMSTTAVDAWLDENSKAMLVNRYNGTLVKGE